MPFSICETPLGETGCLGNPYFLFTGCLSIQLFDLPPFFDKVSQANSGYLLLNVQHLCDLATRRFPSTLFCECYGFESAFFTHRPFLLYSPSCCFQGLPGAGSSASKVAGLHADHWNIALARLLFRITAINKRSILVGSIYVPRTSFEVRVPQPRNLPLTGFEPAFLKVLCGISHLF